MRKLVFTIMAVALALQLFAQTPLQHPGTICCDQVICPSEPIELLSEVLGIMPPESQIDVEYAWFQLLEDTASASGVKWVKIDGATNKTYQPTNIQSQYGGFFMRAVRQVGTLPYLYSNVVNVKILGATSAECLSAVADISADHPVEIYPNPGTESLSIQNLRNAGKISSVNIYGSTGGLLQNMQVKNQDNLQFEAENWPIGLCFIKILYSDGKSSVHKWVKM